MSADMHTCVTCRSCRRVHTGLMACTKPHAARLPCAPSASYVELGRDLAEMQQRCPAYVLKPTMHERRTSNDQQENQTA